MELVLGAASALWLGMLTSVNPCPMTANIAAMSYVVRRMDKRRQVILSALLYALGQMLVYVTLGVLLSTGLLSAPDALARFLQRYLSMLLGPLLIVVGMLLLDLLPVWFSGPGMSEKTQRRIEALGVWGALVLGMLFAASFCPLSAGIFFGPLVLLAVKVHSCVLVPSLYGLGTALPVLVFGTLLAPNAKLLGTVFRRVDRLGRWARRATGTVVLLIGVYYALKYIFELPI
jgi:cytochrome c-type biogenesis protein